MAYAGPKGVPGPPGTVNITQYDGDKPAATAEEAWVNKGFQTVIGYSLLHYALLTPTPSVETYRHSYKTKEGPIVRTTLVKD